MEKAYLAYSYLSRNSKSTSAGISHLILSEFLNNENRFVYGCVLEGHKAYHCGTNKVNYLSNFQGSKYVQSDMGDIFHEIKTRLSKGQEIIFTGTGCQIAGLRNFLGNDSLGLYCIEIICHGVPSPKYFDFYLNSLEKTHKGKIENFSFRNKSSFDRHGYIIKYYIDRKKQIRFAEEDEYYDAFINSYSLRPSCYECKFKNRQGDITIGDSNSQSFHRNEAVSLIIVNNEKGEMMLNSIHDIVQLKETNIFIEGKTNTQLFYPASRPMLRNVYYDNIFQSQDKWYDKKRSIVKKTIRRIKYRIPTRIKNILKGN